MVDNDWQLKILESEENRQNKIASNRARIENDPSYRMVKSIATAMDDYFLDPILGFFLPAIGDILTSVCAVPFIWVALSRVRSIPLTIAVISNTLIDLLLGLIPFYIGDIIDVFNKSYKKNYRLIIGFVEGDKEVIKKVNERAIISGIIIVAASIGIYYLAKLAINLVTSCWEWISSFF